MKQKIAFCAAVLAFAATGSGAVLAQPVPPAYPGTVYPGYGVALPPHEIITIVRSTGLEPLARPIRQGPVYALRAVDPTGQEVRVVVDARIGRIVKIVPVMMPRYGVPIVRPPGRIAMVPDGYGPNARMVAPMPGAEGPLLGGPGSGGAPSGPGHAPITGAPYDPAAPAGPPPLPRPRPKLASTTDAPADKPAAAAAPQAPSQGEAKATKASETTGTVAPPANSAPPAEMHE